MQQTLKQMGLFLPALLGVASGVQGENKAARKIPNVVIIMADDLGYGDLSCYEATEIHTPGIDRLAAEGLRLFYGHATSATSTPSRFAMLTGMYRFL